MHWSLILLVTFAVANAGVVRYDEQLKYDTKGAPYQLPQYPQYPQHLHHLHHPQLHQVPQVPQVPQKDLQAAPKRPLSYQAYPWFLPYYNPYYYHNMPYYPLPYYNRQVLNKDAKQGTLKSPVYNFKPTGYDYKAAAAPQYNLRAPAYDFKVPENVKPQYHVPQFAYPPIPLEKTQYQVHQQEVQKPAPAPVAPAPEPEHSELPELHQEYKEVEMLPELHETEYQPEDKQIVHKDEPVIRSFIFIGKYAGSCKGEKDGLYYVNKKTFAYCVDQRDVFQPCPEGTENPEVDDFMNGRLQYSHHFCSVNLLAQNPEPVPTHADPHYNTYQYEEVPEEKY